MKTQLINLRSWTKNKYFNGNIFGIIIMNFQKYLKIYLFIYFGYKDKRKNLASVGQIGPARPIGARPTPSSLLYDAWAHLAVAPSSPTPSRLRALALDRPAETPSPLPR